MVSGEYTSCIPTRRVIPHSMRVLTRSSEAIPICVHLSHPCHPCAQLNFLSIFTNARARRKFTSEHTRSSPTPAPLRDNVPTPLRSLLLRYSFVPSSFFLRIRVPLNEGGTNKIRLRCVSGRYKSHRTHRPPQTRISPFHQLMGMPPKATVCKYSYTQREQGST